jgi:hypothetical protein
VSDEHAGRRVKCPVCGAVVLAPKPQPPQSEAANEEEQQFEIVEDQQETPRARPAKKSASWDDEDEPRPKKRPARNGDYDDDDDEPRPRKKKKRRRRSSSYPEPEEYRDDYRGRGESDLTALDWLLCIFCPGIGCIVGLIRLITGSGAGGKMVGLSLMFAVMWNVIRFAMIAATGK